jgi:uncharacterized membrane protein (GlpM family)
VGGTVTALIVGLEESGRRTWSGLAALAPVFTVVSYFFIGASKDATAVSQHSKFVLVGTLVSWIPYMAAVAVLAPRIGTNKAIGLGLALFCVLAGGYVGLVERYGLFR